MSITTASVNGHVSVTDVSPEVLEGWLRSGTAVLVDVREAFEFAEERIEGARHAPLSTLDARALRREHAGARIVFHCRSGKRSLDAAQRCRMDGEPMFHLAGGIEGWKASGRSVVVPADAPKLPIMRQVQIVAGGLVAIGTLLGVLVTPWFFIVPGFVGCGLMFAGLSGWCGMAKLLALMPWNRRPAAASCAAVSAHPSN
jgi:rhodanese-related sulfurtransferase